MSLKAQSRKVSPKARSFLLVNLHVFFIRFRVGGRKKKKKSSENDQLTGHIQSFFSSPEPKAQGELIVWDSSRRPSVSASTLSNMNISETSWPIVIKFHQQHHWGGGLAALGFGPDRFRTLVAMATDSSYRVIMGKTL